MTYPNKFRVSKTSAFVKVSLIGALALASWILPSAAQEGEREDEISIDRDGVKIGQTIQVDRKGIRIGGLSSVGRGPDIGDADTGPIFRDDITGGDYRGQNFRGYRFLQNDIRYADFSGADFTGAEFSGVDFKDVILTDAIFERAEFGNVDFVETDLRGACFAGARMAGTDFVRGDISGAILTGARMANTDFIGTIQNDVVRDGPPDCSAMFVSAVMGADEIEGALASGAGAEISLEVNFESGSANIRDDAHAQVFEIAKALDAEALQNTRVRIEGHTDNQGADTYNLDLSYRRALSVAQKLSEDYGLSSSRFEIKGFGETRPIASNETESGRAENRRVVLVNLGPA